MPPFLSSIFNSSNSPSAPAPALPISLRITPLSTPLHLPLLLLYSPYPPPIPLVSLHLPLSPPSTYDSHRPPPPSTYASHRPPPTPITSLHLPLSPLSTYASHLPPPPSPPSPLPTSSTFLSLPSTSLFTTPPGGPAPTPTPTPAGPNLVGDPIELAAMKGDRSGRHLPACALCTHLSVCSWDADGHIRRSLLPCLQWICCYVLSVFSLFLSCPFPLPSTHTHTHTHTSLNLLLYLSLPLTLPRRGVELGCRELYGSPGQLWSAQTSTGSGAGEHRELRENTCTLYMSSVHLSVHVPVLSCTYMHSFWKLFLTAIFYV